MQPSVTCRWSEPHCCFTVLTGLWRALSSQQIACSAVRPTINEQEITLVIEVSISMDITCIYSVSDPRDSGKLHFRTRGISGGFPNFNSIPVRSRTVHSDTRRYIRGFRGSGGNSAVLIPVQLSTYVTCRPSVGLLWVWIFLHAITVAIAEATCSWTCGTLCCSVAWHLNTGLIQVGLYLMVKCLCNRKQYIYE